ncbi:MAG: hypothetical protein ABIO36_01885 [Pyrinomonadaceae bacterium]
MDPILAALDREFLLLDARSRRLLSKITTDILFTKPREVTNSMAMFSCGEYILRSAAMVEKTFGGVTSRLWDDPFEWTLPEKLSDKGAILKYLDEVETTRIKGFKFFVSDGDLQCEIPSPETLRPLSQILLDTIVKASHFQGRAFAVFQMMSNEKLPRL